MSARAQTARGYRMRPAPRRRRRDGPASRIRWDRVGRVALVVVLFVVCVSYVNPIINFLDARGDSRAERSSLIELREENAKLRERAAALDDADAAEHVARKNGMVVAGEAPYIIEGLNR